MKGATAIGLITLGLLLGPAGHVLAGPITPAAPVELKAPLITLSPDHAFIWDGDLPAGSPWAFYTRNPSTGPVAEFKNLVDRNPDVHKLIIRSRGGDKYTGLQLGWIVRKHHLDVILLDYCDSACGDFVAPAARRLYVPDRALMALHGAWTEKTTMARERQAVLEEREHAKNIPLPPGAVEISIEKNARLNVRRNNRWARDEARFFRAVHVDPCFLKCLNFLLGSPKREAWMFSRDALIDCFGFRNIAQYPEKLRENAPPNILWRSQCPERAPGAAGEGG